MAKRKAKARSCPTGSGTSKCWGWLLLVIGVLLLLRDFGYWNFWNLQGWTLLFLAVGLWKLCAGYCK